jgi:hypothetical protein
MSDEPELKPLNVTVAWLGMGYNAFTSSKIAFSTNALSEIPCLLYRRLFYGVLGKCGC